MLKTYITGNNISRHSDGSGRNDDLAIPMIRLNPDGQSVKSENEAKRVPPVGEDSDESIKKAENNASKEEEKSSERPEIMDSN